MSFCQYIDLKTEVQIMEVQSLLKGTTLLYIQYMQNQLTEKVVSAGTWPMLLCLQYFK